MSRNYTTGGLSPKDRLKHEGVEGLVRQAEKHYRLRSRYTTLRECRESPGLSPSRYSILKDIMVEMQKRVPRSAWDDVLVRDYNQYYPSRTRKKLDTCTPSVAYQFMIGAIRFYAKMIPEEKPKGNRGGRYAGRMASNREAAKIHRSFERWIKEECEPRLAEIRRSGRITAKDLAVVINV